MVYDVKQFVWYEKITPKVREEDKELKINERKLELVKGKISFSEAKAMRKENKNYVIVPHVVKRFKGEDS